MPYLDLLPCLVMAAMPLVPLVMVLALAATWRFRADVPGAESTCSADDTAAGPTILRPHPVIE